MNEENNLENGAVDTEPEVADNITTDMEKPQKNKKLWKKILLIGVAAVAVIGIIFGGVLISYSVKAGKIEEQLQNMIFESSTEYDYSWWSVHNISVNDDGTYTSTWHQYNGNSTGEEEALTKSESNSELEVSVTLSGKAILGDNDIGYEIIFEDDEIVGLKSLLSVNEDDIYTVVDESSAELNIKLTAVETFCQLKKWKSNYGEMVNIIFKDYDISCDAVEGSDSKYLVTVTWYYYPNKTYLKNYTEEGTISVEVDINTKEGTKIKDQGITSAYEVYLATSTQWYY